MDIARLCRLPMILRSERVAQVVMGARVVRLQGDRLSKFRDRLVESTQHLQDVAKVVMGFRMVRIANNGGLIAVPGLLQAPLLPQCVGETEMGPCALCIELNSTEIAKNRSPHLIASLEGIGEVVVRIRIAR